MISLMREQRSSILFQRLNQDHVYVIFYLLLPADINSQFFAVTSFFMRSLCGVCKCFNIKYLRLEVIDSISFGLLANALISLLHVNLVLCEFFDVLFLPCKCCLWEHTQRLYLASKILFFGGSLSIFILSGFVCTNLLSWVYYLPSSQG